MANMIMESIKGPALIPVDDWFLSRRKIFFYGEVNEESTNDLLKKLLILEAQDDTKPITLFINTGGGEVGSGLAIYDILRTMHSPVTAVVTGLAASMGSILLMGCAKERRLMLVNSKVMIHDASWSSRDMGGKKPHEIQTALDQLRGVNERLVSILAEGCGKTVEEVSEYTKTDSYFNAHEAIEFGLASEIIDSDRLNSLMKEGA